MTTSSSTLPGTTFGGLRLPFGRWLRVARERHRLATLDPRLLSDIGVDDVTASREAARPFWDLPKGR